MEVPGADQQTALYGLLGFIGTGLMGIARALFKLLNHFLEKSKADGLKEGILINKVDNLIKTVDQLKYDVDGIALYAKTPRAIANRQNKTQEKNHE